MSSPPPPDQWPSQPLELGEEFLGDDPEEETGPIRVESPEDQGEPAPVPVHWSPSQAPFQPADPESLGPRYAPPLTVDPRTPPATRTGFRWAPLAAGAAVVAVLVAVAVWVLWPSPEAPRPRMADAKPTAPVTTAPSADQRKLLDMLPAGYSSSACLQVTVPDDAVASVACLRNSDAGGPPSATYTLYRDGPALRSAFDSAVGDAGAVVCPGNIQSPGPWRRNASPQLVAGTLVCGVRQGVPSVAWTTDADLMLSSARGGPSLDQLYAWWSNHS